MKKLKITEAIGETLGYDITEVNRSNQYKGVAFKRGHIIRQEDVDNLARLGKHHIYVWEGNEKEIHEDTAAQLLGPKIAGKNICFDEIPHEGKISFYAEQRGLFKVDIKRLERINALAIPSLPTIHNHFPVAKGKQVAAFRIIPLTCSLDLIDQIQNQLDTPLLSVVPYKVKKASILVTGNEVYSGRIVDDFTPLLTEKLSKYSVDVSYSTILPDQKDQISLAIKKALKESDLILLTGGTSVDPDDVTVSAMKEAGITFKNQGNPIQPGNNLTIGRAGKTAICAVPAAALFFDKTALDIFLPRILAGETVTPKEITKAGHGGLCHFCPTCRYPICPFGWGTC